MKLFELLPRSVRREIIRVLVEEAGLAKSEVAKLMGVTPSAITRFLRGEAAPTPENLAALYEKLTPEEKLLVLHISAEHAREVLKYIGILLASIEAETDSIHRRLLEARLEDVLDIVAHILEVLAGGSAGLTHHKSGFS